MLATQNNKSFHISGLYSALERVDVVWNETVKVVGKFKMIPVSGRLMLFQVAARLPVSQSRHVRTSATSYIFHVVRSRVADALRCVSSWTRRTAGDSSRG